MSEPVPAIALLLPDRTGEQPQKDSLVSRVQPENAELVRLVGCMARGEQEALGQLYDATRTQVYGLVYRMLERSEDAEEVTLDVYMKAWRNAGKYSTTRGSVHAWLLMMARTGAIDRIRHKKAQPKTLDLFAEDAPEPVASGATPEQETVDQQRRIRVQWALGELPEEQRECLQLAFFSGLSHAELAGKLGQPLGTVKTRIRLGLLRLRKLLGESGFDGSSTEIR